MHASSCKLPCSYSALNALQVTYPCLKADERKALEPIIRGCLAKAEDRWDAFDVNVALYAFMADQKWL